MTAFLVLLVIILFGVVIMQMGKIFKMSKPEESNDSEIASDKDNNINGYLMLGFVFFTYILLIYCFWEWGLGALIFGGSYSSIDFLVSGYAIF